MSETKKKTCQFKSKLEPFYKCSEPALEDSERGYCIFHETREDKDIERFNEEIKRKLSNKDYDFRGYWFPKDMSFKSFTFERYALFKESTFKEYASFAESTFKEYASFAGCTFKRNASFAGSSFEGDAFFEESTFEGDAFFEGSCFEGNAFFEGSTFKRNTSFAGSTFKEYANFAKSTFKRNTSFAGSTFEKVIFLDHIKIKTSTDADLLFRRGKILWHGEGNYVEEGKCHYQEMDCLRKQKNWFIRYIWTNLFHRLLHGYGEKPIRVLLWAVVIIVVCALLFMNFGIGETRLLRGDLPTYNIFKILLGYSNISFSDLVNMGRYFYFSAVTFTTLGYGDLHPTHPISHVISSIEAFVGMFMMALFVLTFGRKWRR